MKIQDYKSYLPFGISILLFVIIVFYSLSIYIGWDKTMTEDEAKIEITLPIISWNKYTTLSKQHVIDKINKESLN